MNDDAVGKALGAWAVKSERSSTAERDGLKQLSATAIDTFSQLNFKVSPAMKSRIKQLAARDGITLLAMLYDMVQLYESKYGALSNK